MGIFRLQIVWKKETVFELLSSNMKPTFFLIVFLNISRISGQYTSFGECGNICRKDSLSCPSLREFCSVCRKLYGGECFNVRKKTYICKCEKVVCGAECIGDHDCQFDENCRSLGTSICPKTCQKKPYRKECCNERKANCLACEQGISVKEFCRKILQNPLMMYSNRYPECKGTQCKEDFVTSPWDTCNKCTCKKGKVTRNCQQTEMQGGLAMMWQMSFYFIGCSDGPKYDGDLCDSKKNNCLKGLVCKDDGNQNGVGRCIPAGPKNFGDQCNTKENNCVTGLVCQNIGSQNDVGRCELSW